MDEDKQECCVQQNCSSVVFLMHREQCYCVCHPIICFHGCFCAHKYYREMAKDSCDNYMRWEKWQHAKVVFPPSIFRDSDIEHVQSYIQDLMIKANNCKNNICVTREKITCVKEFAENFFPESSFKDWFLDKGKWV